MIGIFDSGSGGLTVMRAIRDVLPSADVLYFGDIKHAPYGPRSRAELSRLTVDAIRLLQERGATSIVSACNSVSASLAVSLFDSFALGAENLVEMVGPTVSAFKDTDAHPVLFATQATVDAQIYQTGFHMIGKEVPCIPIPALAGAIERGDAPGTIDALVRDACAGIDWSAADTAILACTHYPLALSSFTHALPKHVRIFDPADAVAARVEQRFWPREAGDGKTTFLVSKDSETFRAHVARLFPDIQYTIEVVE